MAHLALVGNGLCQPLSRPDVPIVFLRSRTHTQAQGSTLHIAGSVAVFKTMAMRLAWLALLLLGALALTAAAAAVAVPHDKDLGKWVSMLHWMEDIVEETSKPLPPAAGSDKVRGGGAPTPPTAPTHPHVPTPQEARQMQKQIAACTTSLRTLGLPASGSAHVPGEAGGDTSAEATTSRGRAFFPSFLVLGGDKGKPVRPHIIEAVLRVRGASHYKQQADTSSSPSQLRGVGAEKEEVTALAEAAPTPECRAALEMVTDLYMSGAESMPDYVLHVRLPPPAEAAAGDEAKEAALEVATTEHPPMCAEGGQVLVCVDWVGEEQQQEDGVLRGIIVNKHDRPLCDVGVRILFPLSTHDGTESKATHLSRLIPLRDADAPALPPAALAHFELDVLDYVPAVGSIFGLTVEADFSSCGEEEEENAVVVGAGGEATTLSPRRLAASQAGGKKTKEQRKQRKRAKRQQRRRRKKKKQHKGRGMGRAAPRRLHDQDVYVTAADRPPFPIYQAGAFPKEAYFGADQALVTGQQEEEQEERGVQEEQANRFGQKRLRREEK